VSKSIRRVCAVVLIVGGSAAGATGCGKAGRGSDSPIMAAAAKRGFVARGFVVGCPNIAVGALPSFGVTTRRAQSACQPNLAEVTVYRTTTDAKKSCLPNAKYFCAGPVYQVRNLVMGIDPSDSIQTRRQLLNAFRTLGTPTRIA